MDEGEQPAGTLSRRALMALGGSALLAACARPHEAGNRLSMWAMGTEGENAPRLLPPFEAATGLGVDIQSLPWTAAHEKILTAYAGGVLPDVMMLHNEWVAELAMLGALAPVPPALRLTADQMPSVLRSVAAGGPAVAVPWVVDTLVQFYRRDLLQAAGYDAPPPDWAGWKRMAHAVKRRHPDRFAVLMLLDWPEHLLGYAAQQPDPLLRDRDARGNFSSGGFRMALAHYKSLFDEGLAPKIVGTEMGDMLTGFADGWFAIMPSGTDFINDLHRRASEIARPLWAAAELPGPDGHATGTVAGSSLAVTRTARDPARAWALVRYLCEPRTQIAFSGMIGKLPSRPSAWAASQLARDPVAGVFKRQLARGYPAPPVPEWERIRTEIQVVAEHMVRGEMGVDAAAREMDARTDRILAKRRWLLDRGRIA